MHAPLATGGREGRGNPAPPTPSQRRSRATTRAARRALAAVAAIAVAAPAVLALAPFHASPPADGAAAGGTWEEGDWALVLVNDEHPLPDDLSVETCEMPGGERVDQRIAQPLAALFEAAEGAGYAPFVRSGFRTRETQRSILDGRVREYEAQGHDAETARAMALEWVAEPGTSEHELGLAVDINDADGDMGLYDWLAAHAHEYGFVRRYPPDKVSVTGIANEPWHYRYVGTRAAREMHDRGLTLEEYLAE